MPEAVTRPFTLKYNSTHSWPKNVGTHTFNNNISLNIYSGVYLKGAVGEGVLKWWVRSLENTFDRVVQLKKKQSIHSIPKSVDVIFLPIIDNLEFNDLDNNLIAVSARLSGKITDAKGNLVWRSTIVHKKNRYTDGFTDSYAPLFDETVGEALQILFSRLTRSSELKTYVSSLNPKTQTSPKTSGLYLSSIKKEAPRCFKWVKQN